MSGLQYAFLHDCSHTETLHLKVLVWFLTTTASQQAVSGQHWLLLNKTSAIAPVTKLATILKNFLALKHLSMLFPTYHVLGGGWGFDRDSTSFSPHMWGDTRDLPCGRLLIRDQFCACAMYISLHMLFKVKEKWLEFVRPCLWNSNATHALCPSTSPAVETTSQKELRVLFKMFSPPIPLHFFCNSSMTTGKDRLIFNCPGQIIPNKAVIRIILKEESKVRKYL